MLVNYYATLKTLLYAVGIHLCFGPKKKGKKDQPDRAANRAERQIGLSGDDDGFEDGNNTVNSEYASDGFDAVEPSPFGRAAA